MTEPNIQEAYGLRLLKTGHPDIRRLKQRYPSAELHGNKFWKASWLLMDYLSEYPLASGSEVLELGCGWGLGGIYCAKLFQAKVIALDVDASVFPFLEHHAQINNVSIDTIEMAFDDITTDNLTRFDTIIGADICFWDSMVREITDLVLRALDAGVPRIVLSDPGRPSFREMAEQFAAASDLDVVYTDWAVPAPFNTWGLVLDLGNY